jgi:hypothetical protein
MKMNDLLTVETIVSRIPARHPVRAKFAGKSSGNGHNTYYASKGHAVSAFDSVLSEFNLCLDPNDLSDFVGNEGRKTIEVWLRPNYRVGYAVFTWYRMESGNWEFIGYLS